MELSWGDGYKYYMARYAMRNGPGENREKSCVSCRETVVEYMWASEPLDEIDSSAYDTANPRWT